MTKRTIKVEIAAEWASARQEGVALNLLRIILDDWKTEMLRASKQNFIDFTVSSK